MNYSQSVRPAVSSDAMRLGILHKAEIPSGFLSTLDSGFLAVLYEHMIDNGVVYVAQDDLNGPTPIGFVSCVESTKRFYASFLIKRGFSVMPFLISSVLSLKFIHKVFESLSAPFKSASAPDSGVDVSCPELLSIVIAGDYKRHGIGLALLNSLEKGLRSRGVSHYKVVAGDSLISANNFYLKNDFELVSSIVVHKGEESNVYIKYLPVRALN